MKTTHTPGPWQFDTDSDTIDSADGRQLAGVFGPKLEAHANARLIAAAPELLAALEGLRLQLREHIKLDVKKHFSLMVADAAAGTAMAKARTE
jgi:hypothetical protein